MSRSSKIPPTDKQIRLMSELLLGSPKDLSKEEVSRKISNVLMKRRMNRQYTKLRGFNRYSNCDWESDYGLGNFGDWGSK